jgi:hypothetical protein
MNVEIVTCATRQAAVVRSLERDASATLPFGRLRDVPLILGTLDALPENIDKPYRPGFVRVDRADDEIAVHLDPPSRASFGAIRLTHRCGHRSHQRPQRRGL